jgi:hypothetical protein
MYATGLCMSLSSVQQFIKQLEVYIMCMQLYYISAKYEHDLDRSTSTCILLQISYKIRITKDANRALQNNNMVLLSIS